MSEERSGDNENAKNNGPSHNALSVREGKDGKSYFKDIGAAFPHKDGKGFNVELEAMPVNGRVVLRTPSERIREMKEGGGKEHQPQSRERE